jgi:hypothetical protein
MYDDGGSAALFAANFCDYNKKYDNTKEFQDIRYFTEKYISGIENGTYTKEVLNKISVTDIIKVYGINSRMLERYNRLIGKK